VLAAATIGNATLLAYDGRPVLATDPWLGDEHPAYFGSWMLSHAIPEPHRSALFDAEYVWFSHGHPDHLNPDSAPRFRHSKVLVPDHVGGRIASDLRAGGFDVTVVPDRQWVPLSEHVRIFCITVMTQDAILLVDVNGHLFVDLNDVMFKGDYALIRRIARDFERSYLLKLSGRGDSDMKHIFDESGAFVVPTIDHQVGRQLSSCASALGVTHVIPFSSFHQYHRTDSAWANEYLTPIDAYTEGFDHRVATFVDPFALVDCVTGEVASLNPAALPIDLAPPEAFGDSWTDGLDATDRAALNRYFAPIELLDRHLGFLRFAVGDTEHVVKFDGPSARGVTFAVPRHSLMTAVEYQIFDDLLIGNFMRTTLHGVHSLYAPNVAAIITKFADNGHARSRAEVAAYLRTYRRRVGTVPWMLGRAAAWGSHRASAILPNRGPLYDGLRRTYYFVRRAA
jgi:hypothetical protein